MKAWQLLDSREKWCQNDIAVDRSGHSSAVTNEESVAWCAWGAILKCYGGFTPKAKKIKNQLYKREPYFFVWHDAPGRTYEEVHALLKELDI